MTGSKPDNDPFDLGKWVRVMEDRFDLLDNGSFRIHDPDEDRAGR